MTEFDYFYSMIGNRLKKNYKNNSKFFLGILFDINNKKSDTLRLGLSRITMEEIEEGIKIISECVNEIKNK